MAHTGLGFRGSPALCLTQKEGLGFTFKRHLGKITNWMALSKLFEAWKKLQNTWNSSCVRKMMVQQWQTDNQISDSHYVSWRIALPLDIWQVTHPFYSIAGRLWFIPKNERPAQLLLPKLLLTSIPWENWQTNLSCGPGSKRKPLGTAGFVHLSLSKLFFAVPIFDTQYLVQIWMVLALDIFCPQYLKLSNGYVLQPIDCPNPGCNVGPTNPGC